MRFPRASGILLHPTSLPGPYGIGDIGLTALAFVDLLAEAGQTYWQMLPLTPTGYGDSPYSSFSAFAGNTLMISPDSLLEDGLLDQNFIDERPDFREDRVDYGGVYEWKTKMLATAFENFHRQGEGLRGELDKFVRENAWWLDDYTLYRSIKVSEGQKPWFEWPTKLKLRNRDELAARAQQLADEIEREKFYQFLFFRQWAAVREHASENGVKIIGDVPIFISLDSADVWCNQEKFKLNPDGSAKAVAGVPPDYFSATGQLWGNPIYDWDTMRADGFAWWITRIAFAVRVFDVVRIDHFRGFAAAWEVPGEDTTAENGKWVDVPGHEFFTVLEDKLGHVPMIAEDLGVITPDVEKLRDDFGLPGMRILQYGFGGDAKNDHLPHNYVNNSVAYTGTHDNDTVVGWWEAQAPKKPKDSETPLSPVQEHCMNYLNTDGSEINWDMIRAVWASVADTAIIPLQDVLGLGNEARMNYPSSLDGNWSWRYAEADLTEEMLARLKGLTETYGRISK